MKAPIKTDVFICGAGPVGLLAALALTRRGASVEIVDAQPHASVHSYALTLHPASLMLLAEYGILDEVLSGARKVDRIQVSSGDQSKREINLAEICPEMPYLAVTGQGHLERTLERALRNAGTRVRWNHRVGSLVQNARRVEVRADELEDYVTGYAVAHWEKQVRRSLDFEADLLIGADGHDSFVRGSLGIDFPEVAPPEDFALFEFTSHCGNCDPMQVVDVKGMVNVRWPISERSCRWSFQLEQEGTPLHRFRNKSPHFLQHVESTPRGTLDAERLRKLLAERVPWCPASMDNIYWHLWARFEKRLAERFGQGRVWLAGDACHLAGPVGVQSMNVGLREAEDLAQRMANVLESTASLATFDEYDRRQQEEWRFLLGITGGLRPATGADAQLVKDANRLISWLPASGSELVALAGRLGFSADIASADPSGGIVTTPSGT